MPLIGCRSQQPSTPTAATALTCPPNLSLRCPFLAQAQEPASQLSLAARPPAIQRWPAVALQTYALSLLCSLQVRASIPQAAARKHPIAAGANQVAAPMSPAIHHGIVDQMVASAAWQLTRCPSDCPLACRLLKVRMQWTTFASACRAPVVISRCLDMLFRARPGPHFGQVRLVSFMHAAKSEISGFAGPLISPSFSAVVPHWVKGVEAVSGDP